MRFLPMAALCGLVLIAGCAQTAPPQLTLSTQQRDALDEVMDDVSATLLASRLRPQRVLVETALDLKEDEIADLLSKEQYVRYDAGYRAFLVDQLYRDWRDSGGEVR